jgi:hypothetical protein
MPARIDRVVVSGVFSLDGQAGSLTTPTRSSNPRLRAQEFAGPPGHRADGTTPRGVLQWIYLAR